MSRRQTPLKNLAGIRCIGASAQFIIIDNPAYDNSTGVSIYGEFIIPLSGSVVGSSIYSEGNSGDAFPYINLSWRTDTTQIAYLKRDDAQVAMPQENFAASPKLTPGNRVRLAFTDDAAGTIKLYIDGVLHDTQTYTPLTDITLNRSTINAFRRTGGGAIPGDETYYKFVSASGVWTDDEIADLSFDGIIPASAVDTFLMNEGFDTTTTSEESTVATLENSPQWRFKPFSQGRLSIRDMPFASEINAASGQFITFANPIYSNTTGGSWEMWLRTPTAANTPSGTIMSEGNTSDDNPFLRLTWGGTGDRNLVWSKRDDAAGSIPTTTFSNYDFLPNEWYHVVFVDDKIAGKVRLYVRGQLVGQASYADPGTLTLDVAGISVLARIANAATCTLNHGLFRSSPTIWTADEIRDMYFDAMAGAGVAQEILFTDGSGNTATATIGSNGTIAGTAVWTTATPFKTRSDISAARSDISIARTDI